MAGWAGRGVQMVESAAVMDGELLQPYLPAEAV
jgi:hypothetical protein